VSKRRKGAQTNVYLKYSGIAFQLFALLLISAYGGQYLDNRFQFNFPVFTIVFIFLSLTAFFYKLIKDLEKDNDKK